MPTDLTRVSTLIFDRAHAIMPGHAEVILNAISERVGGLNFLRRDDDVEASAFVGRARFSKEGKWQGYSLTERGVAIVPIVGELVNRGAWLGTTSGLVSYEGLGATFAALERDTDARAVLLDVDSPGGHAAGMVECAFALRRLAGKKPVAGVANALAASAAYGLISQCHQVFLGPTGRVGSIGVVWVHADRSKQVEKAGIRITILHEGARKIEGHGFAPLPPDVRDRIQAELATMHALFVGLVSEGRNVAPEAVRATEAAVFMGRDAVKAKLADAVASFDEVLAQLERNIDEIAPAKPKALTEVTPKPARIPQDGWHTQRSTFYEDVAKNLGLNKRGAEAGQGNVPGAGKGRA